MARALVSGITGQDGGYLAERLIAEGFEVHGIVRGGDPTAPSFLAGHQGVQLHTADLADPQSIRSVVEAVRPDEVYSLGGISSVAFSWEHPVLTGQVTGIGAVGLLVAAADVGARAVQASSAEIFGAAPAAPQNESTPIAPTSPYGAAKAYAHHVARVLRARGAAVSSTILYNHESPRRPPEFLTRKVTMGAARIAAGHQDTMSLGNLDAMRDWGWAPDYVDAMVRAVRCETPDEYVIATGQARSVREFVATAFAVAGIDDWENVVTVDQALIRPVDPALVVGDSQRARDQLGWQPTVEFHDIVRLMVEHDVALIAAES